MLTGAMIDVRPSYPPGPVSSDRVHHRAAWSAPERAVGPHPPPRAPRARVAMPEFRPRGEFPDGALSGGIQCGPADLGRLRRLRKRCAACFRNFRPMSIAFFAGDSSAATGRSFSRPGQFARMRAASSRGPQLVTQLLAHFAPHRSKAGQGVIVPDFKEGARPTRLREFAAGFPD